MESFAHDCRSRCRNLRWSLSGLLTDERLICSFVFLTALLIYLKTAEWAASWWDCPEYLTTAILLEIGHPPGNPFWMLTHRFLANFSSDPIIQGEIINLASGFFMAGAASLLCAISLSLLRRLFPREPHSWRNPLAAIAASLCFAFSDSAWFSAVEAEVYAMSTFMTALTVWLALRMAWCDDRSQRLRYIVLIAYLTGLSIGVHQLNLLVIPVVFVIWFLSRRKKKNMVWGGAFAFLLGLLTIAAILLGLMPGWLTIAGHVELLLVNRLGLPYNSGTVVAALLSLIICWGLPFLAPARRQGLRTLLWCVPMVLTGYFSYGVIIIRAAANPPMNQGDPSDPFRLRSYMLREQYGSAPLLYGATPYSRPLFREEFRDSVWVYREPVRIADAPQWNRLSPEARICRRSGLLSSAEYAVADSLNKPGKDRYLMTGHSYHLLTTPELDMFLPRIHSSSYMEDYALWAGADTLSMTPMMVSEALDSLGNPVGKRDREGTRHLRRAWRPTYLQNLRMLLAYQFGFMYGRYLLWNFSGRQNDISSGGEIEHGNFLTGIPVLDNAMLGPQELLPAKLGSRNAGHNRYYMIPFLFGLAGIIYLSSRGRYRGRVFWCSLLMFLMTGVAIVFYLNQTPGEPRERDYSFIGSFWVFSFWIATGMRRLLSAGRRLVMTAIAVVLTAGTPALMLMENYDDHNRSMRLPVIDYATLTLSNMPKNAILFVNGDNDTFPFWYVSHLLGIRRDITVVNLSYLSTPWYISSLRRDAWKGKGLEMTMPRGLTDYGGYMLTGIPVSRNDTVDAVAALRTLYADTLAIPTLPSRLLSFGPGRGVLDLSARNTGMERPYLSLRQLAMIDILATNAASDSPRPVVWHLSTGWKDYCGFYPLTRKTIFGRLFDPDGTDPLLSKYALNIKAFDLEVAMLMSWDSPSRQPFNHYLDDVTTHKLRQLRRDILLTAGMLRDSGMPDRALSLTRVVLEHIPPSSISFRDVQTPDSLLCEARLAASLLPPEERDSMLRADSLDRHAYHRFRHALTPAQRHALSPKTLHR